MGTHTRRTKIEWGRILAEQKSKGERIQDKKDPRFLAGLGLTCDRLCSRDRPVGIIGEPLVVA